MNKVVLSTSRSPTEKENEKENENTEIDLEKVKDLLHSMKKDELAHYGVLGMKWGIRNDRSGGSGASKAEKPKSARALRREAIKERKAAIANRRIMSKEDLQAAIARLELEKRYADLVKQDIDPGKKVTSSLLKDIGTKSAIALTEGGARSLGQKAGERVGDKVGEIIVSIISREVLDG